MIPRFCAIAICLCVLVAAAQAAELKEQEFIRLWEKPPLAHSINQNVSPACSRLILCLMEKKREQRIQTPQALIKEIDAIVEMEGASTATRTGTSDWRVVPSPSDPPSKSPQQYASEVDVIPQ